MKNKAVGEDGEERGETFDGVDQGDGNFLCGSGGKDVASDLEECEREGGCDDVSGRTPNAIFEGGDGAFEGWEDVGEEGEEDAPGGDEDKLNEGEGYGFGEGGEDGFRGGVGQGGGGVPDEAEDLGLSDADFKKYEGDGLTMSLTDMGAFSASAISCALALTLPFLVLIVRIASLRLFCRPCLDGPLLYPWDHVKRTSRFACHRSVLVVRSEAGIMCGLGVRELVPPADCSS